MAGYGYATQVADDVSRRTVTSTGSGGDDWVLKRFSRVLAIALGKKLWATEHAEPPVPFGEVIERVQQAQMVTDQEPSIDVQVRDDFSNRR